MRAVYAVFFRLEGKKNIEIGALGDFAFEPGLYVYLGSAMNGVESRLKRHFSEDKKLHWHIDYFSQVAEPIDYFVLPESSDVECVLADTVASIGTAVPGFGSSDCGCKSHFFKL